MKALILCFFLLITFQAKAQTLEISHPFLIGDFLDFGVLDPFERCNNPIITTNSLDCRELSGGDRIQLRIPLTFLVTNTALPTDVQIRLRKQPVPGSRLRFSVRRNGGSIGNNSVQTFTPLVAENLEVRINIWLFGSNSTNLQTGEIELDLIIP